MPSAALALLCFALVSHIHSHMTLTSTKLRVELGALSTPAAGVKLLNQMMNREKQVLDIYQDKALRCMVGSESTHAVHWSKLEVHRHYVGDIEDIGGQMECESTLRRHSHLPDIYNDEDVIDYPDWLMYEIIPFISKGMHYYWLQGLHAMMETKTRVFRFPMHFIFSLPTSKQRIRTNSRLVMIHNFDFIHMKLTKLSMNLCSYHRF